MNGIRSDRQIPQGDLASIQASIISTFYNMWHAIKALKQQVSSSEQEEK